MPQRMTSVFSAYNNVESEGVVAACVDAHILERQKLGILDRGRARHRMFRYLGCFDLSKAVGTLGAVSISGDTA